MDQMVGFAEASEEATVISGIEQVQVDRDRKVQAVPLDLQFPPELLIIVLESPVQA